MYNKLIMINSGLMKRILSVLAIANIVGCASAPPPSNPIAKLSINCPQATQMSTELDYIIRNPNSNIGNWGATFASLNGFQTTEQRISSAKTVLWTIRTRCPGF
jgi:type IV pilus biogenesis protein CpaD/CtpE